MRDLPRVRAALLLSGGASLVQELCWNRLWVQVFGSSHASTATVLAVFMAGLGLGAWTHRRWGRALGATGRPLYQRLEVGVALFALLAPALLSVADTVHLAAARSWGLGSPALGGLRLLLATVMLLPPAALMGATLPSLCQELAGRGTEEERVVASLYAWNTAGAVLGVVLTAYLLLPVLGISWALRISAAASLAAVLLVGSSSPADAPVPPPSPSSLLPPRNPVLAIYAFVGFWGMALEVLFTRAVLASAGASSYALATVLAAFLAGIALGAGYGGRHPTAGRDPRVLLGSRMRRLGGMVAASALLLPWSNRLYLHMYDLVGGFWGSELACWALGALFLLPTGVGLGSLFPVAARALMREQSAADAVGGAYLVNSLAGAGGALAAYHLLAPAAGTHGALLAAAASFLVAGTFIGARQERPATSAALASLTLAALLPVLAHGLRFRLDQAAFRHAITAGVEDLEAEREHWDRWLYFEDGPDASVGVVLNKDGNRSLRINGKGDADLIGDMRAQVSLGTLPMLLAPEGAEGLMFGLGAGGSADAALRLPMGRLDIAELCPSVVRATRVGFRPVFPRPHEDPRAHIHVMDGRLLVRGWDRKVDLIASEPTNLYIQGVSNLYTREFFQACRERLKPGGLLVQWIQSYNIGERGLRLTVRTLTEVFPHVALAWFDDFFFLASDRPIRFDMARVRERLRIPEVQTNLARAGIPAQPSEIASRVLATEEVLRDWAGPGPLLTDDCPVLEFLTARGRFRKASWDIGEVLHSLVTHPSYDAVLPLDNLAIREPDGARRVPLGGFRLGPGLGGTVQVVRENRARSRDDPVGIRTLKVPTWTLEERRVTAKLEAFPRRWMPSALLPHRGLAAEARRGGLRPPPLERGRVHGHLARWQVFPGTPAMPHRALLSWTCPVLGASYILSVQGEGAQDDKDALAEIVPKISCLHPGEEPGSPKIHGTGTLRPEYGS